MPDSFPSARYMASARGKGTGVSGCVIQSKIICVSSTNRARRLPPAALYNPRRKVADHYAEIAKVPGGGIHTFDCHFTMGCKGEPVRETRGHGAGAAPPGPRAGGLLETVPAAYIINACSVTAVGDKNRQVICAGPGSAVGAPWWPPAAASRGPRGEGRALGIDLIGGTRSRTRLCRTPLGSRRSGTAPRWRWTAAEPNAPAPTSYRRFGTLRELLHHHPPPKILGSPTTAPA